jgi:hypothetical protein
LDRIGLDRAQVDALRRRTFGDEHGTLNSSLRDNLETDRNVEYVWFSAGGTVCLEWGKIYRLSFDSTGRLGAWKSGDWWDGC